ncbi:MAG: ion transporter [Bacteroidota bacterium]|nr:ion transporter [Flavisolibacter sp.]MDQ3845135.1 ion transporter [Bacteroidota bacterium]
MQQQLVHERKKLLHSIESFLEGPMIFLGFVWLVLLVIELIWGLPKVLEYMSLTIWVLFIIDFVLKFILAPDKLVFFKKNWLTAISLVIPALRIFRIFRIIRLLRGLRGIRLIRVVSSLNRSMRSLGKTMKRRGFGYVVLLSIVVTFGGAAGMYALEKGNQGFENYGMALWWTAMRVITAGSDFWPTTPEGRGLAFLLSIFGYAVFGYVTATLATFFIGRDAEEKDAPVAGAKEVAELKRMIQSLTNTINKMNAENK